MMRKIVIDGVVREEVTETQLMNEATMIRPALPTFETILVRPESWGLPRCIVCGAPATWISYYPAPNKPPNKTHYFCRQHHDEQMYPLCPYWKGKCVEYEQPSCPKGVICRDRAPKHAGEGAKAGRGYIGPSIPGREGDTVTRRGTVLFDKTSIKEAAQDKSWYLRAGVCSKCGREIPEGAGRGLNYPDYICLKCDGKKAEWPITDPDGLEYELRTLITREREKR